MADLPAYFLTWTTYGSWLHGDPRGSVDDAHNKRHTPWLPANPERLKSRIESLNEDIFLLDDHSRTIVHAAIERVCKLRSWKPHAINVRTNHVHIVLSAISHPPEQVMGQLKSWSTRDLRASGHLGDRNRIWTKMGSTRWLKNENALLAAIDYVLNHQ